MEFWGGGTTPLGPGGQSPTVGDTTPDPGVRKKGDVTSVGPPGPGKDTEGLVTPGTPRPPGVPKVSNQLGYQGEPSPVSVLPGP